jgi:hypothetical protein
MPPPLIVTTLKFLFIALLYVFIARAIRVIYLDLVGPRASGRKQAQRRAPVRRRGVPRLISVTEPDKPMRTYELESEVTFGRTDECDIALDDTYVSTKHARIFEKDGTWLVEDLGSTNGTYLNRTKVTTPSPLSVGDEVRVGKTIVEVRKS